MTITKKPTRPKKSEEPRDAIASAFIQAAENRAKAESGTPPKAASAKAVKTPKAAAPTKAEKVAKPPKTVAKKVAPEKEPLVAAETTAVAVTKEKKSKDKEKGKEKDKGKKKKHKKKEAVIIRFEDAQLLEIDSSADALGLSRAAWVRMVVARALAKS